MTKKFSSFGADGKRMGDWRDYLSGNKVDGWYGLVNEEYERLVLESGDTYLLDEGVWEKFKYLASKAGSLEKGGKIIGGRKLRKQEREKLHAAIKGASSKVLKDLDHGLRDTYPNFPNMEKQEDWVRALVNIGGVYDSLVQAAEAWNPEDPTKEGTMDCTSANVLIDMLRKYTRHQLDYELADIYKHFKEGQESGETLDELFGSGKRRQAKWDKIANAEDRPKGTLKHGADSAQDFMTRSKRGGKDVAYTKRGQMAGREETESTTWAGLKSNLLPVVLGLGGAAAYASGIMFQSDWFQAFFQKAGSPPEFKTKMVELEGEILEQAKPGSVTERVGFLTNGDPTTFGPNATLGDLQTAIDGIKPIGGNAGGIEAVANLGSEGPGNFLKAWKAAITGANGSPIPASTPLEQVFGMTKAGLNPELMSAAGGPGMFGALQLQIPEVVGPTIKKVAFAGVKKWAVTGGQTAAGAAFATAGSILQPLGVALMVSGIAVKLIRVKGMKSSRAQMLKDLLQEMIDIEPCGGEPGPDPENCDEVIEELMSKFKPGMIVRYFREHGEGNITGMSPKDDPISGGETLLTRIVAMESRKGSTPEEQQKESDLWKEEKTILISVKGMIALEAGDRQSQEANPFDAAAIRACKLNIGIPTEADIVEAYKSAPKQSERWGLEKPEGGPASFEGDEKQKVYMSDVFDIMKKSLEAGKANVDKGDVRKAVMVVHRLAKETGNPQKFVMARTKASHGKKRQDIRDYLEEAEVAPEAQLRIPVHKIIMKLQRNPELKKVFGVRDKQKNLNLTVFISALKKAGLLMSKGGEPLTIPILKRLMKSYVSKGASASPSGGGSGGGSASYFDAKEGKRKRPCTSCKKSKKKVLKESRKDDHWDNMKERWKTLSGIK